MSSESGTPRGFTLRSITVFPVKSTTGRRLESATVEPLGLEGDRRWMVVGPDGECVTARTDQRLLQIQNSVFLRHSAIQDIILSFFEH